MKKSNDWLRFFWRISSCHIVSYMVMGILAMLLLNYNERFETGTLAFFMRPTDSPVIALGPVLQVIRGFIFAIVLWPIKDILIERNKGWLKLWGLLIGVGILGTIGPTPGSVEGFIYTKLSITEHLLSYPEGILQTLLFSILVYYWYKNPTKAWNIVMSILISLTILMSISGYYLA